MRKIVCLITVIILAFSFVSCGKSNTPSENEGSNNASIAEPDGNTSQPSEETNEKDSSDLAITYKVPMKDIYIDAPNYQEIEQAYTELFIVHESKYVAITAARRSEAEDCKDAHDKAFDEFKVNMQNYEGGVNSLNIINDSNATINGIEVYRFDGTLNYGRDTTYDGYAVGYAFIMDGIPCEIIGSVIDDSQSDALKTEIASIVDAMMKSVRSEQ